MKNYSIKYDKSKNRVYVTFNDTLDVQAAKDYVKEFKKTIDKTKSRYTVCFDLSTDPVHNKKVDEIFAEGRAHLKNTGVKATASILSKSAIAKMQSKRMMKEFDYEIFASKAEADKYLDSL